MPAKKPAKPTRLQVKADKKDKVLTGPKGSKPQSTTTNRVRTQGGTTMSKPKPAPSAGRRTNPKAAKPKPAPKPAAKPATPSGGGRNLFGGAGNKPAAINKADSQKAPKPAFRTSRAPLSGNGPFGTRRSARPSLGNVKPGPAAAAAPRQQAQAQGQANVRAAQQRRENLARVQRDLRGQVGKAASVLSGPAALARQAIAESVAPRPTAKGTLKGGGAKAPTCLSVSNNKVLMLKKRKPANP
jgi:translation initiation factor IF-2